MNILYYLRLDVKKEARQMSSKKNRNMKNEAKLRKNKMLFGVSAFCSVLFLVLLVITPSAANLIGLAACLICAMRLYSEIK